jgi:hypothetical protein
VGLAVTESLATALRCIDCASEVALDYRLQCPSCGGLLELLLTDKAVDPDATICVILSETGLKTEAVPPAREAIAFDEASLRRLVGDRLGGRS